MSLAPVPKKTELQRPRLGFLGAGWIGRKRLESIAASRLAEIVAVADPVSDNLTAIGKVAPHARLTHTLEELIRYDLDGLVIATPSALHAEQAITALRGGCAVFCQKPLGRCTKEVAEIIAAAQKADRLLGVDLSYRHCRGLLAIRDLITRGELGHVFEADLVFHNAYGPAKSWFYDRQQSGGGCVIDLGIHLVDLAMWILPGAVTHVTSNVYVKGRAVDKSTTSVEDYAFARLRTNSNAAVNITCSWHAHAGRDALIEARFHGTEGGAAWYNIGDSFTEFRSERYSGTCTEVLTEPPEDWGSGAITTWAKQLSVNYNFDPAINEHLCVAEVLDAIYRFSGPGRALGAK